MPQMRLTILFNRFGPYHLVRLKAAGACCELTAIEFSAVDNTYEWDKVPGASGFTRVTLFTDSSVENKSTEEVRRTLWQALSESNPDVIVIPGWGSTPALLALQWSRISKVPAVLMSDSQEIDEPRVSWKEWVKAKVVKQFSAGLVGGGPHKKYLTKLGLPERFVFSGYDVVDNEYFSESANAARAAASWYRNELRLPENFFLKSCRFIEKKNLFGLLDAYAKYSKETGPDAWQLVIIGDGVLRPQLEEQIKYLGLDSLVHLPGFKQYDELPVYYGLAGAYIQASTTEQWGLVVNEAMASGLPVLVSERCGCAQDLVQEGVNGFTFDPFDLKGLPCLMGKISSDDEKLEAMGLASSKKIMNWSPEVFADNLLKAAGVARNRLLPKTSWVSSLILNGLIYR